MAGWSRVRRTGAVTLVATVALGVGAAQAGGGNTVKGSNFNFKPKAIRIEKGEDVHWKWVNGHHTVTFVKGSYDKSLNKSHPRLSRTFKKAGTFKYYCRFHRSLGMKGKVVVQ
jgi:plastocyanin